MDCLIHKGGAEQQCQEREAIKNPHCNYAGRESLHPVDSAIYLWY